MDLTNPYFFLYHKIILYKLTYVLFFTFEAFQSVGRSLAIDGQY